MDTIEIKKYNDVWLDNGLVNLFSIFKNIQENNFEETILSDLKIFDDKIKFSFDDQEKLIKKLSKEIKAKRENLILNVESKQEKKEIKKDFILIQEGKKIQGKVKLKENIYTPEKTELLLKEMFASMDSGNNKCTFCNRTFNKKFKKIQQASYPFVTKIRSLSGVRSGDGIKLAEYFSDYCVLCYLSGILEWTDESLIYRSIPGKVSFLILPNSNSLKYLRKIKKQYVNILNNDARWCNIKVDIQKSNNENEVESPYGKFSTLLSFYESFIATAQEVVKKNEILWYIIEIPSGAVKNLKYYEINFEETILKLFNKAITKRHYIYRNFIKNFYAFNIDEKKSLRNFDEENELREKLCEAIGNNNFHMFAMSFIPKKGYRIGMKKEAFETLETILKIWRMGEMEEKEQDKFLKMIKESGRSLAKLIDNKLSLFFKLEKTKNKSEFFKVIQEITRRLFIDKDKFLAGSYEKYEKEKKQAQEKGKEFKKKWINSYQIDALIECVQDDQSSFQDIKNLILIYTSLNFGRNQTNKGEK